MAAHARLKNEFAEDKKCHNLMTWLKETGNGSKHAICGEAPGVQGNKHDICGEVPGVHSNKHAIRGEAPVVQGNKHAMCGEASGVQGNKHAICGKAPDKHGAKHAMCGEAPGVPDTKHAMCGEAPSVQLFPRKMTTKLTANEPSHEIVVLFVLRKLILQTRIRSHPVGIDV